MSMNHKAFAFDDRTFTEELRGLLVEALRTGEGGALKSFIDADPSAFEDPDEGGPLDDSWQSVIATGDPQTCGDVALTKYYDPTDDIGVDGDWMELDLVLAQHDLRAVLLGEPLGSRDRDRSRHLRDLLNDRRECPGSRFRTAESRHLRAVGSECGDYVGASGPVLRASGVPIATHDVFRRFCTPACEALELRWVPLFETGIPLEHRSRSARRGSSKLGGYAPRLTIGWIRGPS